MACMIASPYLDGGFEWLRGNLHAHTTESDGEWSPAETVVAYERAGYDFLAISDHDRLTPVEPLASCTSMILIPACEVSANGPHVLAAGIRTCPEPHAERQQLLDAVAEQGGISVLNHPSWGFAWNHFPQEAMEGLAGYAGIEIYNGVIEVLEGCALATDRWDRLLSAGRRAWGFAHDDLHKPDHLARGWLVAQVGDRSPDGVLEALRRGRFYASTGVTMDSISVEGDCLSVHSADAEAVRFIGRWGRELARRGGGSAEYRVNAADIGYVRAELYGAGMAMAWTQPSFVREN